MVFDEYAQYYDLLYQNKDYQGEAAYIDSLLQKYGNHPVQILELGCGTGRHAQLLAQKGYIMQGLDMSEEMLQQARPRGGDACHFMRADIRDFDLQRQYDACISLFHVMSYQNSEQDFVKVLQQAKRHLVQGGVFIFDCWYGPAVLWQKPELRVKRLANSAGTVTRIAEPVLRENDNIVEVHYDIFVKHSASGEIRELQETHCMRYYFPSEVKRMAEDSGFRVLDQFEFFTGEELSRDTWGSCYVIKKT